MRRAERTRVGRIPLVTSIPVSRNSAERSPEGFGVVALWHVDRRVVYGVSSALIALAIYLTISSNTVYAHTGHDDAGSINASATIAESCESVGLFTVGEAGRCTHGPDPAPPGVDPAVVDPPVDFSAASFAVCDGNGLSGDRVQVLYVHASDKPDRYNEYLESFRGWAGEGDAVYQESARETGGERYIRFVHDANCRISVLDVTVSPSGDEDFWTLTGELWNQGFHEANRKYLVFFDKNHPDFCGQATTHLDSSPGQFNTNNQTYGYAVIYNGCWSSNVTIAHELGHDFGAVQRDSPNASKWDHCVDEWDVMCYDDGSGPGYELEFPCEDVAHNERLDCNHDDYFSTNPNAGTYLATHWNIANSDWLGSSGTRMALSKDKSKFNGWVDASLSGFAPNQQITLFWPDLAVLVQTTSDAAGNGIARFRMPLAALGTYTVLARDSAGNSATDLLRVIPRINLNEDSGYPGTVIRVYFYGFEAGDQVEVQWYDLGGSSFDVIGTVTVAENGRGTSLVTIPYGSDAGAHMIRGDVIGVGRSTSTTFTVIQSPWQLTLSKESSKYNGIVEATMTGFAPNSAITLRWPDDSIIAETTTDGGGSASASFRTPLAPLGDYTVLATDASGTIAGEVLRVIPRINLNEFSGYPGTVIRVYYYGFAPGNEVEVKWYDLGGTTYAVLATVTIADNGRGTSLITIPEDSVFGNHLVRGDVIGISRSASTSFEVLPTPWHLSLSKDKSKYNGNVTATMTGFPSSATVTLYWPDGDVLAQTTADGAGGASATFRTPLAPLGNYTVRAIDTAGNTASATLRVIPRIKLTEYSGAAGITIRVYLYGFAPGNEVEIKWYDTDGSSFVVLETVTIADNGRASRLVEIPEDATIGEHRIRGDVIDVSRSASDTFEVISTISMDPTATPPATATPDPTVSATPDPSASVTPTPIGSGTPEPSGTVPPTVTPAPTETMTPVPTDTATPKPTVTDSPLPEPTATPAATADSAANLAPDRAARERWRRLA
jgi:hypothetical protein